MTDDSTPTNPIVANGDPRTVFSNRFMSVETSDVTFFPSGTKGEYSVVKSSTGRGVVVLMTRRVRGIGYVAVVRQFRFPLGRETIEFPRGGADEGESYADAAVREVREETGFAFAAERLNLLGLVNPDTGLLSTEVAVYTAHLSEDLGLDAPWVEAETGARVAWFQTGDFLGAMDKGKITDALTLAAWALFQNSNFSRLDAI